MTGGSDRERGGGVGAHAEASKLEDLAFQIFWQ